MPTALESRAALRLLTGTAVESSLELLRRVKGSPDQKRAILLETVPDIVAVYADGSAVLGADSYEDARELAAVSTAYTADAVVADRTVKVRRAIAWSAAPLFIDADDVRSVADRLSEVVQLEVARPYRDTILTNRRQDPASVGWRRITVGGCRFCRMLADRGAVYRQETARFAAHTNCHCTAQPVFKTDVGPEASVMQYVASHRKRTEKQRSELRSYLDTYY